jgi:hypothetical protein
MRSPHAHRALLAVALCLPLAACGSSSSSSSPTTTSTAATTTTASSASAGGSSSVTSGPVRGALRAPNHTPTANKKWPYSVTVTDAAGKPLSGTVDIEFVFGGQVVGHDTPPTHPVKNGRWHDLLTFPPAAIGQPLTFRAVVRTQDGSITLDWPVTVHR